MTLRHEMDDKSSSIHVCKTLRYLPKLHDMAAKVIWIDEEGAKHTMTGGRVFVMNGNGSTTATYDLR